MFPEGIRGVPERASVPGHTGEAITLRRYPHETGVRSTREGYDFQVRLGGYALNTSTGNFGQIHFDNVRDESR